jgi:hypothetical protein
MATSPTASFAFVVTCDDCNLVCYSANGDDSFECLDCRAVFVFVDHLSEDSLEFYFHNHAGEET